MEAGHDIDPARTDVQEAYVRIYCKGLFQFRHIDGGPVYTISPEEIDFEAVGGEERQMDPSSTYEARYNFDDADGNTGSITWTLVEYPAGAENFKETQPEYLEIIQDFDYGLEHEDEEPDEPDETTD